MIGSIKDVVHDVEDSWHFNKGVSVMLIVGFLLQTIIIFAGGGWYAGRNDQRMESFDNRLSAIPTKIPPKEVDANFVRIAEELSEIEKDVAIIKNNQKHYAGIVNAIAHKLNVHPEIDLEDQVR